MKYKVKRFGRYGLHIILRKQDGFKEGQEVEIKTGESQEHQDLGNYEEFKQKLLRDEEFIELIYSKLQSSIRRF